MRLTVLGGAGVFPPAGGACSGYLVEHEGYRVLVDPGYATTPRLLGYVAGGLVDAVIVSHGHPDHCADLNPLLRARTLHDHPAGPLPVHAPPGALRAVLALDRPGMMGAAIDLHEFEPGAGFEVGPFAVRTALLPHWLPNAGMRLMAAGRSIVYTGDAGPDPALVELARDADVLLAEATFVDAVPGESRGRLSSARDAGMQAADAAVGQLVLVHLQPGTAMATAVAAAASRFAGPIAVAVPDLVVDLD